MQRYQWAKLNEQQVEAYAEYFVKMELTMYGFQAYETEVDDRGIDFVARFENGPLLKCRLNLHAHLPTYSLTKKNSLLERISTWQ